MFLKVGLPLKADIAIPGIKIPVPQALEHPFQKIKKVEKHQEQFCLLPQVDALVVYQGAIVFEGRAAKDNKGPEAKPHVVPVEKMSDNYDHASKKRLPANILFNPLIFRPVVNSRRSTARPEGMNFHPIWLPFLIFETEKQANCIC
jgi:hypothetical protein